MDLSFSFFLHFFNGFVFLFFSDFQKLVFFSFVFLVLFPFFVVYFSLFWAFSKKCIFNWFIFPFSRKSLFFLVFCFQDLKKTILFFGLFLGFSEIHLFSFFRVFCCVFFFLRFHDRSLGMFFLFVGVFFWWFFLFFFYEVYLIRLKGRTVLRSAN